MCAGFYALCSFATVTVIFTNWPYGTAKDSVSEKYRMNDHVLTFKLSTCLFCYILITN